MSRSSRSSSSRSARDDAGRQLETIAGRPLPAALVEELHVRSGGNPFFLEELFAARGAPGRATIPRASSDAVLLRIGRLDDPAARVLGLVAAAGGRSGFELLERLTATGELEPAMRSALDAGLLVRERDDGGVCFRHALMTEVVYGELLPPERVRLHRRIAEALSESAATPASQLAIQWYRAGARADALAASVAAGLEAARVYAFSEARAHLERALELWDAVGRPRRRRPSTRPSCCRAPPGRPLHRGPEPRRGARARGARRDRRRERPGAGGAPLRAARRAPLLGRRAGPGVLRASAGAAAARGAGPERARLLAAQGHALMGLRRLEASRRACEAALAVAAAVWRAGAQEAQARTTLGLVLAFLGDGAAGEAHVRRALELAEAFAPGRRRRAPICTSARCSACAAHTPPRSRR